MRKNLIHTGKIAAAILLAGGIVACNKEQTSKQTSTQTEKNTELIVFVNSDSLLNNYEYFKNVREQFQEKSKKAQTELNAKGTAFQREVAAYQQSAPNLSAEQRAATEERLARKQQELAAYNQNAGNALANEEAAENEKLYNKVADYLKKHAKAKGYKMVLTYTKSNPNLLFADESLDITKEVVNGLNEEFKKEKK